MYESFICQEKADNRGLRFCVYCIELIHYPGMNVYFLHVSTTDYRH